ncbi:defensin-like protein, partial [Trifolium medium]|nr:defensin-like protein [Trifolium medium]
TPLIMDEATKKCAFGHCARILVDLDLSKGIFDEVMVERDGYAFYVELEERNKRQNVDKPIAHYVEVGIKTVPIMAGKEHTVVQKATTNLSTPRVIEMDCEAEPVQEHVVCVVHDNGGEQATRVAQIEEEQVAAIVTVISDVPSEQNVNGDAAALVNHNEEEQDVTAHYWVKLSKVAACALEDSQPVVAPVLPQVVYDDIEKIKQVWVALEGNNMTGSFTSYVSKKAKKQQQILARSIGNYNTRSKGPPSSYSQ